MGQWHGIDLGQLLKMLVEDRCGHLLAQLSGLGALRVGYSAGDGQVRLRGQLGFQVFDFPL